MLYCCLYFNKDGTIEFIQLQKKVFERTDQIAEIIYVKLLLSDKILYYC